MRGLHLALVDVSQEAVNTCRGRSQYRAYPTLRRSLTLVDLLMLCGVILPEFGQALRQYREDVSLFDSAVQAWVSSRWRKGG